MPPLKNPDDAYRTLHGPWGIEEYPELVFEDSVGGGSRMLPPAADVAAETARVFLQNPNNRMLLPASLKAADADGDGTIDAVEFNDLLKCGGAAVGASQAAALFAEADADGDGELSVAELQALGRDVKPGRDAGIKHTGMAGIKPQA